MFLQCTTHTARDNDLSIAARVADLTLFVIPNSDAYLAQKYASEFPAYAARTPTIIPLVKNKIVMTALACCGLIVSLYLQLNCTTACGLR